MDCVPNTLNAYLSLTTKDAIERFLQSNEGVVINFFLKTRGIVTPHSG